MKIKHISIKNNPILWDIELNFIKDNWTIIDTILLYSSSREPIRQSKIHKTRIKWIYRKND